MERAENYTDEHLKLMEIMQSYGNEEFGDNIIDEICQLFNYPLTPKQ